MTIASIRFGNYHIEARNNMMTGVETVYVNGRKVSSQFNIFHGIHRFSLPTRDGHADEFRVDFRASFTSCNMVAVDIILNGECLLDQSGKGVRTARQEAGKRGVSWSVPANDRLELKQLDHQPLYREEDLV